MHSRFWVFAFCNHLLHKPRLFIAFALCIAIVLFSGCVSQELSESERFLCIDLSSKAYAFVPKCDSEDACFKEVNSKLFGFDSRVFSQEVRSQLFSLQNNLALSWLYFNKAKKNLSEINSICSSGSGISALALQTNELNNNLLKALEFSDKASQSAFSILALEEQDLEFEKIALIKEEPLFNDFVLLNNNLNDLQSKSFSDSFAGFYLAQMQNLQSLISKTGFSKTFIDAATPMDFFEKYNIELLKQSNAKRIFEIPFMQPLLESIFSFLNNFFKIHSASDAMQKMPAFEFMQSYNNLSGSENSAIKKFSELLESDALHRKELSERNKKIEASIEAKISSASEKIEALSAKQFVSFDANFFAELYSLLGQDSSIATQKFSLQDFSNFREKAIAELLPLRVGFQELEQKDFLKSIPIGEKTLGFKTLDEKLSVLLENLDFLESETTSGLEVLCAERLEKISNALKQAEFSNETVFKASDLKARLEFRISEFNASKETDSRLLLCKRALGEFSDFRLSMQDFEEYSLKQQLSLGSCFESLEKIFSAKQGLIDLSDFALRLQKIKSLEDLESAKSLCNALQDDTENFLNNNPEIATLKKSFFNSQELFRMLALVDTYSELSVTETSLNEFNSKFSSLGKYFLGNSLVFEKALPVLQELRETVFALESSLEKELDNAIADFASKNHSVEFFSNSAEDSNVMARIQVSNPFKKTAQVVLKIPFPKEIQKPQLPQNFSLSGNFLAIKTDSLALGISFFDFYAQKTRQSQPVFQGANTASKGDATAQFLDLKRQVEEKIFLLESGSGLFEKAGISSEKTATAIATARELIWQAETLFNSGDNANAIKNLLKAHSSLQIPAFEELGKKILEQKNKIMETAKNFLEQLDSIGEGEKFSKERDSLLSTDSEIERSIAAQDYNRAAYLLDSLGSDSNKLVSEAKNLMQEKAKALSERADSFAKSVSKETPKKISSLFSLLESVPEETLLNLNYVAPISKERLQKLELQLSVLDSPALSEKIRAFKELVSKQKFSEAIAKFNEFEKELSKKEAELNSINSELDSALSTMREDAVAAANSASTAINSSPFSADALELVSKSKTALEKNQFLKSIAFSNAATALLSTPSPGFQIPVFFYPILAGIALVFIVRHKKRQILEKKAQFRKILRNRQE